MKTMISGIVATFLIAAAQSIPASAADHASPSSLCTSSWAASALRSRIDYRYLNYTQSGLKLRDLYDLKTVHSHAQPAHSVVDREFCHARVRMSDNRERNLWYVIETSFGFAGIPGTAGVEFCISGLDRWHVNGRDCRSVRDYTGK